MSTTFLQFLLLSLQGSHLVTKSRLFLNIKNISDFQNLSNLCGAEFGDAGITGSFLVEGVRNIFVAT